jgi:hypothetical protein
MLRGKVIAFTLLIASIGTVALVDQIGISWFPPAVQLSNGAVRAYAPADIRNCMGARALSALGDRVSQQWWRACEVALSETGALDAFNWRYWLLGALCCLALLLAVAFAIALRSDRAPLVFCHSHLNLSAPLIWFKC